MKTTKESGDLFKITAAAGMALSACQEADAAIQVFTNGNLPAVPPFFGQVETANQQANLGSAGTFGYATIFLSRNNTGSVGSINFGASSFVGSILGLADDLDWVQNATGAAKLAPGFVVENSLTANSFGTSAAVLLLGQRLATGASAATFSSAGGNFNFLSKSSTVQGYLGFRLEYNSNTHFGWAEISISYKNAAPVSLQILRTAIEDVPGQSISVGAIPEPSTVATGLGLLALGAAGLRERRKRKKPVVA